MRAINRHWKGKNLPNYVKAKISNTLKGRKMPQETKDKISKALKGKMPKNIKELNKNKNGKNNPIWKGDLVKYRALHSWVQRTKPKQELCNKCNLKKRLYLSNISGKYKRDINDYEWLCQSCHMKKDFARKKVEVCEKNFTKCLNITD